MIDHRFRVGKALISRTTPSDAKSRIVDFVRNGVGGYICVSNPRTVTYASRHADYLAIMDHSLMNLPDAEPMLWAAKLWGLKDTERTMGPLLFQTMLSDAESDLKHFLLGDTDGTLSKLRRMFPEANIVGTYSPPFAPLEEYDIIGIAKMISESGADIVWLSLRAPKQDILSSMLSPLMPGKVCIGVGAAFRFALGEYKIAPPIIKKFGLMGLYWGKKNQKWLPFIWGYLKDNVPYLFMLAAIPFKRLFGIKCNS